MSGPRSLTLRTLCCLSCSVFAPFCCRRKPLWCWLSEHWSMSIVECYYFLPPFLKNSSIWNYCRFLGYLVSDLCWLQEMPLSQIRDWLVTLTGFVPHCSSLSCRQDTIVVRKVCDSFDVVSPLVAYRVPFCTKDARMYPKGSMQDQLDFYIVNGWVV